MTEEQFLSRLRLQTLQQRLTQKVTEKESKRVVTDAEAKDYYDKNKSSLALPVRRDVNVVLAQTKRRADQAKKALEGGQSLKRVAEKYSIDAASKAQGGRLRDVAKGQHEKAFDEAVFSARKGELEGPVKTRLGYYVFEVTKVSSASQPTFDKSKERIENLLRSQRQQKAIEGFREDLRERYREKTICADEFVVAECDNGPEAKTNTGRAPGSTPQSPQPVPPGGGAPQRRTPQAPPPRPQSP
jgi:foldase protein PrsA